MFSKSNKNILSESESLLLETLSFYEWLTKEKIIIDMNVKEGDKINLGNLEDGLKSLVKKGYLSKKNVGKEFQWKRKFKKHTLLVQLLRFFRVQ